MSPSPVRRPARRTPRPGRPTAPFTTPFTSANPEVVFAQDRFLCPCISREALIQWCDHLENFFEKGEDIGKYGLARSRPGNTQDLVMPLAFGMVLVPCVAAVVSTDSTDFDAPLMVQVSAKEDAFINCLLGNGDSLRMFLATMNSYWYSTEEAEESYMLLVTKRRTLCRNPRHSVRDTAVTMQLLGIDGLKMEVLEHSPSLENRIRNFATANAYTLTKTGYCWACNNVRNTITDPDPDLMGI